MRTIKEVATLTGISVRTLQYYDEIGVFKPTKVTSAGYRMYDDESLGRLQQILLFKELQFQLKDIKIIMDNPNYDRIEAFRKQKELLRVKRDRLNKLLELLDKLEKGESCMSFKEFDLSEYIQVLERFKKENADEIKKYYGSMDEFQKLINKAKEDETNIAQTAIEYYGSVEKYTEAIKENLSHFSENMEKMQKFKENGYVEKNRQLMGQFVEDVTKDPKSGEIQQIVEAMIDLGNEAAPNMNMGENYYDIMIDKYLHDQKFIDAVDKMYGAGSSKFMGEAYQFYFQNKK